MDALPPAVRPPRFPVTFWVTVAFLVPASILRVLTVTGSMKCLGGLEAVELRLLIIPYALLLVLAWFLKNTGAAAMVVAVGAVAITAVPLTLGLWAIAVRGQSLGGYWCGEGALLPGLFAGLQVVVAVLVGMLAGVVWLRHRQPSTGSAQGRLGLRD